MSLPTWGDLLDCHCTNRIIKSGHKTEENIHYEPIARRRYNYSAIQDDEKIRLVFLRHVLENPTNKTLVRNGRFVWCNNLCYEGRNDQGWRQVSFSLDKGQKRFLIPENNFLCIPSKTYINNNRYFRRKTTTFIGFSSLFCYESAVAMMSTAAGMNTDEFRSQLQADNPLRPGTLVAPRLGYFYPELNDVAFDKSMRQQQHPCGIVLGRSFDRDDYMGREFYRVRFGTTTYERVNAIELEIINEV